MKYFQVFFCLSLVAISAQARALPQEEPRLEYKYECQVQDSDAVSFVTVDANGKYVVYEDPGNNCNGRQSRLAHSSHPLFETDCEWKDGFVDFLLEPQMIEGESQGRMIAGTEISSTVSSTSEDAALRRYQCKRIQ